MRLPGLITKREHDEIVAGYQSDIAKLAKEVARLKVALRTVNDASAYYGKQNAELHARLAPFIAVRDRNPDGTFKPTRPVGEMVEGGNA